MKSTTERVGAAKPLGAAPVFSVVLLFHIRSSPGLAFNWIFAVAG